MYPLWNVLFLRGAPHLLLLLLSRVPGSAKDASRGLQHLRNCLPKSADGRAVYVWAGEWVGLLVGRSFGGLVCGCVDRSVGSSVGQWPVGGSFDG